MTDAPYNGFRFIHSRKSVNAPGGVLKVHIIAVARSLDEAMELAGEVLPMQGLELFDSGAAVLQEAKQRGIANGQAIAI